MASSLDYQKIWDSYQGLVKTKNMSIVDYCQRNGIVYSQFERWYKKYVFNFGNDMICYREDSRYTIDNMEAERSIRPFVVSRKGYMFFSSEAGVKVAMIFHTIIETAKMWGHEAKDYLSYVMSKLIHNENDYEKLLPSEISL